MSSQAMYSARIQPSVGGSMIDVKVQANDVFQARRLIESIYGPIKLWQLGPTRETK
jgi:hypothetical protein